MTENQQPNEDQLAALIREMGGGERPLDRYIARSFWEIFRSGQFNVASRGITDVGEETRLQAIRIIGLRDGQLGSYVITNTQDAGDAGTLHARLVAETENIPDFGLARDLPNAALHTLQRRGIQTVAGLQVGVNNRGAQIIEFYYPKAFRTVGVAPAAFAGRQGLSDTQANSRGLQMSAFFLKTVPFGDGGLKMPIPAH
jgi:hypothetical protein